MSINSSAERAVARARAAARARARDDLVPREREMVIETRGELGAALRGARFRRALAAALQAPRPAARALVRPPSRRGLAVLAAAAAVVFAVLAFVLLPREGDGPAGGAPAAAPGTILPQATLSRGRSQTAVPVVVVPTAQPTQSAPPTGQVGVPGGTGGGGGPAGTVEFTRFTGRVIDARTGNGIPNVCIGSGTLECSGQRVFTDSAGEFVITLPAGSSWFFNFSHASYVTATREARSTRTQANVDVGTVSLAPR